MGVFSGTAILLSRSLGTDLGGLEYPLAVLQTHALLIGIVFKDKPFDHDMLAVLKDEARHPRDHRLTSIGRPDDNGIVLRAMHIPQREVLFNDVNPVRHLQDCTGSRGQSAQKSG